MLVPVVYYIGYISPIAFLSGSKQTSVYSVVGRGGDDLLHWFPSFLLPSSLVVYSYSRTFPTSRQNAFSSSSSSSFSHSILCYDIQDGLGSSSSTQKVLSRQTHSHIQRIRRC